MTAPRFAEHLIGLSCFACGTKHGVDERYCRACGQGLRVDYQFAGRDPRVSVTEESLWRYASFLPIPFENAVTLGEGWTPLVEAAEGVWIKDESGNPTGSFKDRGMSVAVSAAHVLGASALSAPSAGNAADSLAAYGAAAGLPVTVAMPADTPRFFVEACRARGAEVVLVPGSISAAGEWLAENGPHDALDLSTLREPFRVEGKKTMAYEIFEQMEHVLPEVIVYPAGGGTGLIGMWKAFDEMERLGWIGNGKPRLVAAQSDGCAPIVHAFASGASVTTPWPDVKAAPHGLRVPNPAGGSLCLRALTATQGTAVAVEEGSLVQVAGDLRDRMGIDMCPEGGAAWAAYEALTNSGWIGEGERVVVFNTGAGRKYG